MCICRARKALYKSTKYLQRVLPMHKKPAVQSTDAQNTDFCCCRGLVGGLGWSDCRGVPDVEWRMSVGCCVRPNHRPDCFTVPAGSSDKGSLQYFQRISDAGYSESHPFSSGACCFCLPREHRALLQNPLQKPLHRGMETWFEAFEDAVGVCGFRTFPVYFCRS